jgi:hypothetical protein
MKKQVAGVPLPEVTVPQHHPIGEEAEVDFGDVSFYLRGVLVTGHMFVMRLSASGKGFHHVTSTSARRPSSTAMPGRSRNSMGCRHEFATTTSARRSPRC